MTTNQREQIRLSLLRYCDSAGQYGLADTLLLQFLRSEGLRTLTAAQLNAEIQYLADKSFLVAAQLLAHRNTRADAIAMLEQACDASDDVEARGQILTRLLDAPADADDAAARRGWFERLSELQRDQGSLEAALSTAVRAAREMPEVPPLWDRVEAPEDAAEAAEAAESGGAAELEADADAEAAALVPFVVFGFGVCANAPKE